MTMRALVLLMVVALAAGPGAGRHGNPLSDLLILLETRLDIYG